MNKHITPAILVLGLLIIYAVSLLFHAYTYAEENIYNAAGDLVWGTGEVIGSWRDYEWIINIGTKRIITIAGSIITLTGLVLFFITTKSESASRKIMAAVIISLATLTTIGFLTVFYPCYEMMAPARLRPMRCVWTMRVLLGVNGVTSALGFFMLRHNQNKDLLKGINIALILTGCLFLLIPQTLTGVCVVHRCVSGFQPFARTMGALMLVTPIINAFMLNRKEDSDE